MSLESYWKPVQPQLKVLVLSYKAINNLGPTYLRDHVFSYLSLESQRSGECNLLQVLSVAMFA